MTQYAEPECAESNPSTVIIVESTQRIDDCEVINHGIADMTSPDVTSKARTLFSKAHDSDAMYLKELNTTDMHATCDKNEKRGTNIQNQDYIMSTPEQNRDQAIT